MKNRMINTKFWNDSFVINLNPLDRYLFLYLLTNEHTNIAGIYELPLIRMAQETGIDKEMLPKMLKRLAEKVRHTSGWVVVKNFQKHQKTNDSIGKGIDKIMGEIPAKISHFYTEWVQSGNRVGTECDISESESESELESKYKDILADKSAGKEINEVLDLFKIVNPNFEALYKNRTQRKALGELLKKWGRDKIERSIKAASGTNGKPYAPTITTPLQLRDKLGQLIAFWEKDKNSKPLIGKI